MQVPALLVEDREHPAFGGDVETVPARVQGQYIKIVSHALRVQDLQGVPVPTQQFGVTVAGDECAELASVDEQALRVVASGRAIPELAGPAPALIQQMSQANLSGRSLSVLGS